MPYSFGETVVTQQPSLTVSENQARVVHMKGAVYLSDVAKALNKIGATPRDIIAIFQALTGSTKTTIIGLITQLIAYSTNVLFQI